MKNIREMILVSLFAALTSIGAYLTIPLEPVSITLQVVFCLLAGILLGRRLAAWSQILYILIGLMGVPVFAGGGGGYAYILKPSFGFILGFIIAAYVTGWISEHLSFQRGLKGILLLFLAAFSGLCMIYLVGLPYMYVILTVYLGKTLSILQLLTLGFFPFILIDVLKCLVVAMIGNRIRPAIKMPFN